MRTRRQSRSGRGRGRDRAIAGGRACDASTGRAPDELDALLAALAAAAVTAALTPLVGRVSRRFGLLDEPRERGLSERLTPLLGGVAILAGVLVAALVFIPIDDTYRAILAGAVIAFDLGKASAGVLAAIIAGAALGFLVHNFHPASVFMGDCGSNLLGYLLGAVIVEGSLKTNALIALVGPLVVLAVPFLDTGFVLAKRLKYHRPVYRADRWHFHHRMANIGFSQRQRGLSLSAWVLARPGPAGALGFAPYGDRPGGLPPGGAALRGVLFLLP